ncbi:hypothetical protein [Microseira wollei]|uniref:Uncharacterized protein n=1 Tax=Microseira wollei NIES-4236 TaxID=2530354 RepID=A0AAV3XFL6_9CYAN|nr:hypothetical protein [Microseira wollei]GET41378.1 hypothetical protein MiSe_61900 [Microseira wollei NIES-4236]
MIVALLDSKLDTLLTADIRNVLATPLLVLFPVDITRFCSEGGNGYIPIVSEMPGIWNAKISEHFRLLQSQLSFIISKFFQYGVGGDFGEDDFSAVPCYKPQNYSCSFKMSFQLPENL